MRSQSPKKVHVNYEEKMSLDQAINFLDTIVTKLKEEKSFTITHAGKSFNVAPSSQVELEVKLEERNGKQKLELELEWREGEQDTGGLTIE